MRLTILALLVAVVAVECKLGDIKKNLKKGEQIQNVLKIFTKKMDKDDNVCKPVALYPTVMLLQNASLRDLMTLKKCFSKIDQKCARRRRPTLLRRRKTRSETVSKCRYRIVGAGSSNDGKTYFTPIIFKQRRGLRVTGKNATIWLSETPKAPFTKLEEASGYSIATWVYLKVAVHQARKVRKGKRSPFERLLDALKKSAKKNKRSKPSTKWVDLYLVNAQLDVKSEVAEKQLEILFDNLKERITGEAKSIVLTLSTPAEGNVAQILSEEGFLDARKTARSAKKGSGEISSVYIKNLQSIYNKDTKSNGVLSSLLYQ